MKCLDVYLSEIGKPKLSSNVIAKASFESTFKKLEEIPIEYWNSKFSSNANNQLVDNIFHASTKLRCYNNICDWERNKRTKKN